MSSPTPSTSSAALPPSLLEHTLKTAPINVITGTAVAAGLGGLTGSAFGVARNVPAIPAAFQTAIKSGVFGFTFFSLREYAISPLLISANLAPSPFFDPTTTPPPSPHTANLLPTSISGFLAGTAFSSWTRSSFAGAPRAGLTLAVLTSSLQLITNELSLLRIHLLAWGEARRQLDAASPPPSFTESGLAPGQPLPPTYSRDISQKAPLVPSRETFSERSDRLIGSAWRWTTDRIGRLSPVKKMEEGEYVERLEGRRREVEEVERALGR